MARIAELSTTVRGENGFGSTVDRLSVLRDTDSATGAPITSSLGDTGQEAINIELVDVKNAFEQKLGESERSCENSEKIDIEITYRLRSQLDAAKAEINNLRQTNIKYAEN